MGKIIRNRKSSEVYKGLWDRCNEVFKLKRRK